MELSSVRAQDVTVTVSELPEGSRWTLQNEGDRTYALVPAAEGESGAYVAEGGKVTFTAQAGPVSANKTYTAVEGRAASAVNGTTLRVTVQDPAISEYAEYTTFTLAGTVNYTRRADGSTAVATGSAAMPQVGDYVIVHAGFAIERLPQQQAEDDLEAWRELADVIG